MAEPRFALRSEAICAAASANMEELQRLQAQLRHRDDAELRRRAAVLVDELLAAGTPLGPESLEPLLLRPPWSSTRCKPCSHNVARSRAALIERQPRAVALLRYVDATTLARAPYRRLTQRHSPWAEASARATIAAVQRARLRQEPPRVLVAEGGLGVEAAVAAAAGAIVVCCEPNPHCARAVAAVAEAHGVGPRVSVVQRTLEQHLRDDAAGLPFDVVVLAPLLEYAGLGHRLLPAATAAAAAASTAAAEVVPFSVALRGAVASFSAGSVEGVDVRAADVARWSPYPQVLAPTLEEGATLVSAFTPLLHFDLQPPDADATHATEVRFECTAPPTTCNALVLELRVDWSVTAEAEPPLHPNGRHAVLFLEPFVAAAEVTLHVRHNGLRVWAPPPDAPPPPLEWGRLLLQHWHFAMLADAPRNLAYAAALARAAAALEPPQADGPLLAVDAGCGCGILSLMLAKRLRAPTAGVVLGVEVLRGAAHLARRCIAANGADDRVEVARCDAMELCTRSDGRAPLLVAELMDNGGLGEGMLPLAAAAARGGLLAPGAQIVPKRLRVFCTLVELRGCGDAHDGAELTPSSLCGVSLAPWLAYRTRRSYAAVDLAAAEYCALSEEWLLLEAELGAPPPDGGTVAVPLHADGTLNAIVWTWEADLDDSGSPDAMLSNAHHAPRTHWRQAAQLFEAGRTVCAGETAVVRFATGGGRALSFELEAAASSAAARPPARFRPHLLRQQPAVDAATAVAPARSVTPPPPRPVSYTHQTLPTRACRCRSRWSPYH